MKRESLQTCFAAVILASAALAVRSSEAALTNSWTNSTGAAWSSLTSWSLGFAPSIGQSVCLITNAGTKIVTIDVNTPTINLTISNLLVSAPGTAVNGLTLAKMDPAASLHVLNNFTLSAGGAMFMTNATLQVDAQTVFDGPATLRQGATNVCSGAVILGRLAGATGAVWVVGGKLDAAAATTRLGSAGVGQMTISNGSFLASTVDIGLSAGSQGTLTVVGGSNVVSGMLTCPVQGNASLFVGGGTLTVGGTTVMGISGTGSGEMTVSNGTLNAGGLQMGGGTGAYTLRALGGTANFAGVVEIGRQSGVNNVWVTGGVLSGATIRVGAFVTATVGGTGAMTVSNGTALAGAVTVAALGDSLGTLTIAGGTNAYSSLIIGDSAALTPIPNGNVWMTGGMLSAGGGTIMVGHAAIGRMTVSNGTVRSTGIVVSDLMGGRGTLTFAGGTNDTFGNVTIGRLNCTTTGIVTIAGGKVNITNAAVNATLQLNSGTLTISGGITFVDRIVITNVCAHYVRTGGVLLYNDVVLNAGEDTDGDGIPNSYELAHGLDPLDPADSVSDTDGDGQTALQEYLAGTDPNNAVLALRIISIIPQGDDIRVRWTTVGGRTNVVQATNGGAAGNFSTNFTDLATIIIGGSGDVTNTFIDPFVATNNPARYYRVRFQP